MISNVRNAGTVNAGTVNNGVARSCGVSIGATNVVSDAHGVTVMTTTDLGNALFVDDRVAAD